MNLCLTQSNHERTNNRTGAFAFVRFCSFLFAFEVGTMVSPNERTNERTGAFAFVRFCSFLFGVLRQPFCVSCFALAKNRGLFGAPRSEATKSPFYKGGFRGNVNMNSRLTQSNKTNKRTNEQGVFGAFVFVRFCSVCSPIIYRTNFIVRVG